MVKINYKLPGEKARLCSTCERALFCSKIIDLTELDHFIQYPLCRQCICTDIIIPPQGTNILVTTEGEDHVRVIIALCDKHSPNWRESVRKFESDEIIIDEESDMITLKNESTLIPLVHYIEESFKE